LDIDIGGLFFLPTYPPLDLDEGVLYTKTTKLFLDNYLGEVPTLQSLFDRAGLPHIVVATHPGTVQFPSIRSWVYTDINGWVLADMLDDAQFDLLLRTAEQELQPFVTNGGTVSFGSPAHIVTVAKP
jgi:hypothetical protein